MRKLFVLLTIVCLYSCSNDSDSVQEKDKEYDLHSIMWTKEAGDGEEFIETVMPERVIMNTTQDIMSAVFKSSDYVEDSSCFTSDDPNAFMKFAEGIQNVSIPTDESLSEGYYSISGEIQAPYQEGEVIIPSKTVTKNTFEFHPNTKLIVNDTIITKKLTLSYRIICIERNTNQELIVNGKWTGKFYLGEKLKVTPEIIK